MKNANLLWCKPIPHKLLQPHLISLITSSSALQGQHMHLPYPSVCGFNYFLMAIYTHLSRVQQCLCTSTSQTIVKISLKNSNTYLLFTCQIYMIFVMMEWVIQRIQLYFFWIYRKLLQKQRLFFFSGKFTLCLKTETWQARHSVSNFYQQFRNGTLHSNTCCDIFWYAAIYTMSFSLSRISTFPTKSFY